MENDPTFCAPSESYTSEEVFLTGASRLPASRTANPKPCCHNLDVSRKISLTSAASPVCRLQFFQPANSGKEATHGTADTEMESLPCEGILIYDDQERKARFFSAIH